MRENQKTKAKASEEMRELSSMGLLAIVQQGSRVLLKEAIEAEITAHLGRLRYEHGAEFRGHRNGVQQTAMDTPIGPITYDRPKVAHAKNFRSRYHTPHARRPAEFSAAVTDMYVNGVSTRKVKDALKSVAGEKVRLSRSTVSRITKKLREEFCAWQKRSLENLDVAYLFLDAIRVGMRMGGTGKDAVLVAYAILQDGTMELLALDLGHSESNRSWGKFVEGMKLRGLKDPLLVCSDGNAGVMGAIDTHFATSYRQRCLKHREQNILDAVSPADQERVRKLLHPIFYGASSLEQAKSFVKKFQATFRKEFPTAVSRLESDLDQALSFYLFPAHHWKRMRTSNKLERLNREIRRRLDVIGRHPDELGCMALIYAVSKGYASSQRKFRVDDLAKQLWKKLREQKVEMLEQLTLDLYATAA